MELTRWEALFAGRTRVGHGDALAAVLGLANVTDIVSFAGGFPDPATFPVARLRELFAELDPTAFQYTPTAGLPGVRDFIAGRLDPRPEEGGLMVTSGSIDALELFGKAFLDPGDTVVVEGPSYMGAIMSFQSFEADVVAVPLDEDGLRVDELESLLAGGLRPKLLYTIPDYQNPAGVSLVAERRTALVELARRFGFLVVEDVAYRELGWEAEPPPTLWSLGPDVVVQAGTFSKIFFPGVRLGWAAGPPEVVAKLVWAKQLTDQCAGALGQRLLEEHGRRGWLDEQIAAARELYRARCEAILAALDRHAAGRAEWTRPGGGFFTWLTLPVDATELAARALEAKVAFVPGVPFYADGRGTHEARLSFSRVTEDEIELGIERLASLLG
ncbi:MAG TPA: PLP-dependent aminotransferase family protein [Gaiellaceae bacterium]|nr:PLP-dependent aminotransferase family protein [Gaiellaceae bacterium]